MRRKGRWVEVVVVMNVEVGGSGGWGDGGVDEEDQEQAMKLYPLLKKYQFHSFEIILCFWN